MAKVSDSARDFAPSRHDASIGNWTIGEGKDAHGIVVRVQAGNPARAATTHCQRKLGTVTPLFWTPLDFRRIDRALPNTLKRVANDDLLCRELRLIGHVLKLTATASVSRVMQTRRVNSDGGRRHDTKEGTAREMSPAGNLPRNDVSGRGARNEDNESFVPSNAVASGSNRLDCNADDCHQSRSASRRAACFHESAAISVLAKAGAGAEGPDTVRAPRSRWGSRAPAIAATLTVLSEGRRPRIEARRRSSH